MNIKENIGNRITKIRKELGITIKELAARTESLSAGRISNWEQGTRSPGPQEAKLVAKVLNVSPAYLLCLTDNPQGEIPVSLGNAFRRIPLLNMAEVPQVKDFENSLIINEKKVIVLDGFNNSPKDAFLYAVRLEDSSMQPDINPGDLIIVERDRSFCPGDLVLAYLFEKEQTVLRKYGESDGSLFQLFASNPLWATTYVKNQEDAPILGVVTEHRRYL